MERHVAEQVLASLFDASLKINTSLLIIQKGCTDEEFRVYRRGTGRVLAELYSEFIGPILKEHPDLEPEEMKGSSGEQG